MLKNEPENKTELSQKQKEQENEIAKVYGMDKVKQQQQLAAKMKYAVLTPSQFDDHEVIAMLERFPIHKRSPRFNEELAAPTGKSQSKSRPDEGDQTCQILF